MTTPKAASIYEDPRDRFPEFKRLPRVKSWVENGKAPGSLVLCEVRKDPRTGQVLVGRFPM